MKINSSSLTTRLYMWFYGVNERNLPQNLCPYFWKLVFMFLVILPYSVFCLPVITFEIGAKLARNEDQEYKTSERIWLSVGFYIVLLIAASLVMAIARFWITVNKDQAFLFTLVGLGSLLWIAFIVIGAYYLIKWAVVGIMDYNYRKTNYDKNGNWIPREPKVNIVKEFVKAKYHKYCPRIEWISNEAKHDEN